MKMLRSSISAIDDRPVAAAAAPLLVWYERNKRALPWREDRNPYHIWLSEIMLQQTRVEAVIPYYHRFLAALPTIGKLAAVEEEQLLKLWEGLGYYSRARNLKKAAVLCVEQYGGMLPPTYDELLKLPGFGPYTAAAVASIAFGAPVPAVDGNVLRVVSRLCAYGEDINPFSSSCSSSSTSQYRILPALFITASGATTDNERSPPPVIICRYWTKWFHRPCSR